jgi:hypothetical protein
VQPLHRPESQSLTVAQDLPLGADPEGLSSAAIIAHNCLPTILPRQACQNRQMAQSCTLLLTNHSHQSKTSSVL